MIYFDGCYIAKYYLAEPDSAMVQRKAVETGAIACALHGKLETASVFHRKLREGSMTQSEYHLLRAQFETDISNGLWSWLSALRWWTAPSAVSASSVLTYSCAPPIPCISSAPPIMDSRKSTPPTDISSPPPRTSG